MVHKKQLLTGVTDSLADVVHSQLQMGEVDMVHSQLQMGEVDTSWLGLLLQLGCLLAAIGQSLGTCAPVRSRMGQGTDD